MPSWFFNNTARSCAVFIYGGCNGNKNRFPSYYDCQDSCNGRNLTFCELQREINSARLDDFIPRCAGDGEFEVVQCHSISGECWCVDKAGLEIPGTKTLGTPKCDESQENLGRRTR
ncbi:unnamed protein product [Porites lobata]|uniref:Thyroglobulin type-1 domain-containing protein n=1 Tax=Porites lobata TaxID=104759 RepID=A0ABN8R9A5_9CNID|nr:unnamed protein product [Porites lobata]